MSIPSDTGEAHQLRFKTELDTKHDILVIEQQIAQLGRERLITQSNEIKKNKTLQSQLESIFSDQQRIANERLSAETRLQATNIERLKADKKENALELTANYQAIENILQQLSVQDAINKVKLQTIKEELDYKRAIEDSQDSALDSVIAHLGKSGEIFKYQKEYNKLLKNTLQLNAQWALGLGSILALMTTAFNLFKDYDAAMAKFRMYMGALRGDTEYFTLMVRELGTNLADVNVKFEDITESIQMLGSEFGGTNRATKELVEATTLLKAQLGVAQSHSAGFLKNISAISKTTAESQKHMLYYTDALAAAAGVPLDLVMGDVAKASGNALAMLSRMPGEIVKTAVAARTMGTSLNKMADASRQILNFTENVQSEMEASVLLGRNVNLQLARELAYRRDIEGSTKAILNEAKRLDFENMDVFQMEAFANATGRSTEEILKMIQAQRQLDQARHIDGLKEQVAEMERLKALNNESINSEAAKREMMIRTMANQERMTILQNQFNKMLLQATETFFPVIDIGLRFLTLLLKIGPPIAFIWVSLAKAVSWAGKLFGGWSTLYSQIFDIAMAGDKFGKILMKVYSYGNKAWTFISKVFSVLGKLSFLGPFMKVIPIIGWVITAFQLLSSLIKRIQNGEGWGAVTGALYDVFLKPFEDVLKWIKKFFGFGSPSFMILDVIKGIIAGQAMMFDALTYPFRQAFAWVVDNIPFLGKSIGDKIRGGMTGALQDVGVLEKSAVAKVETPATVTASGPLSSTQAKNMAEAATSVASATDQQNVNVLNEILKGIAALNANLTSGKVAVYIDGQLVSATLARQTAHLKSYGAVQVA